MDGLRLGLCCLFLREPIRFRATTAAALRRLARPAQLDRLAELCLHNARSLQAALEACVRLGIGAFRVMSPLFPRATHPEVGYELDDLPRAGELRAVLSGIREYRARHDLRLSFHPDQFVVLSSAREAVAKASLRELEHHGLLAELLGAEVVNVHVGGATGGKGPALERFAERFARLSPGVRSRLTVENDDVTYTVSDLAPLAERLGLPLVYDVHHHRCNPDGLGEEEATDLAARTFERQGREPWAHVSSPRDGPGTRPHADYVRPDDLPACWLGRRMTVDVEAKAKELAVLRLARWLRSRGVTFAPAEDTNHQPLASLRP